MESDDELPVSFDSLEEYKKYFESIFISDTGFSEQFRPLAKRILLQNVAIIYDHERHETKEDKQKDLQGIDDTIRINCKVPCALRVRRDKPKYIAKGDFTIDTKEWRIGIEKRYYVYGYGIQKPPRFRLYVFFDYSALKKAERLGKIKGKLEHNYDHSRVPFWCFKLSEMFEIGLILDWGGEKQLIEQILGKDALKPRNLQLTTFV